MKSQKAITLISLVITIIILIILASVAINLSLVENGIFNRAKQAREKYAQVTAKEKLEFVLLNARTEKEINDKYNSTKFLDSMLEEKDMEVNGDSIIVDNYNFIIDRESLTILESIGKTSIKIIKEVKKYLGKNEKGKYEVEVLLVIENNEGIKSVKVQKKDGTIFEIETEQIKLGKDITLELNEEYIITVITSNGKEETRKIVEKSEETIRTLEELVAFGEKINSGLTYEGKTINLVNDIDLGGSESNRNWKSIGNSIESEYFSGIFEGNNHKILNIYNMDTTDGKEGLFGVINGGTVQNLGIESGHIKGKNSCGGIVGRIDNGNIINCYNNAKIEGGIGGNIGGIVGLTHKSIIKNCHNSGEITGVDSIGGIIGTGGKETEVLNCYNIESVIGETYVGGIAGYMEDGENLLNNCYNKGNIEAKQIVVGGIIGCDEIGTKIKNSYSTGRVESANGYVGGVIGWHKGSLSNLFFINTAGPQWGCGVNDTDKGLEEAEGSTETTLKGLTNKLNEGQEGEPWKVDENNINEGYPILS